MNSKTPTANGVQVQALARAHLNGTTPSHLEVENPEAGLVAVVTNYQEARRVVLALPPEYFDDSAARCAFVALIASESADAAHATLNAQAVAPETAVDATGALQLIMAAQRDGAAMMPPGTTHKNARGVALRLATQIKEQGHRQNRQNFPFRRFAGFAGVSNQEPPFFSTPPLPLAPVLRPVPSLPAELVPAPFRDWLQDVTARMNCASENAVIPALIAASAVIGRKVAIRPKRYDDWQVVPNLWGAVVGPPSVLKSPASEEAMRPLQRLVAEAFKRQTHALEEYQADELVRKAKSKAAGAALDKSAKAKTCDEHLRAMAQTAISLEESSPPTTRRYIVNDPTVEALGERLRENANGLLLYRDELSGFLRAFDKPGHETDRSFYLEAWNGNGSFTSDRIGRGTVHITGVCLSLYGTIQPGPLARYIRAACGDEGADGLIQRFQLLVYPDVPKYQHVDRYPDNAAKNRAFEVFRTIDALTPADVNAEEEQDCLPFVRFTPDAQHLFNEWLIELETQKLRTGREHGVIEAHFAKYRSLMPALALLFHLLEFADGKAAAAVSLRTAEAAAAWCELLEAHARRIYDAADSPDYDAALALVERIRELPHPFKPRDVVKKGWSKLATSEDVAGAIALLETRGWVQTVELPAGPQGGRPALDVWVHPDVLKPGGAK